MIVSEAGVRVVAAAKDLAAKELADRIRRMRATEAEEAAGIHDASPDDEDRFDFPAGMNPFEAKAEDVHLRDKGSPVWWVGVETYRPVRVATLRDAAHRVREIHVDGERCVRACLRDVDAGINIDSPENPNR